MNWINLKTEWNWDNKNKNVGIFCFHVKGVNHINMDLTMLERTC